MPEKWHEHTAHTALLTLQAQVSGAQKANLARCQKTGRSIWQADAKGSGIRQNDFAIELQGILEL
jgi:hypothetical protein